MAYCNKITRAAPEALAVLNTSPYIFEKSTVVRDILATALTFDVLQQRAQFVKICSAAITIKIIVVIRIPGSIDLVVVPDQLSNVMFVRPRLASVGLKMEHHG